MEHLVVKSEIQVLEKWQIPLNEAANLNTEMLFAIRCHFPLILYKGCVTGGHGHGNRGTRPVDTQSLLLSSRNSKHIINNLRALEASDRTLQLKAIFEEWPQF